MKIFSFEFFHGSILDKNMEFILLRYHWGNDIILFILKLAILSSSTVIPYYFMLGYT